MSTACFRAVVLVCGLVPATVAGEELHAASVSPDGRPSAVVQAESPHFAAVDVDASPARQAELLVLAAPHVLACYAAAARAFGEEYAEPPLQIISHLNTMFEASRVCMRAGADLSHSMGCGAEVRLFSLGALRNSALGMLDLAGCCPAPREELVGLLERSTTGSQSALARALGERASTLLGIATLALALAKGADSGLSGERTSLALSSVPLHGGSMAERLWLYALLEASISPHLDACPARAEPMPTRRQRWPLSRLPDPPAQDASAHERAEHRRELELEAARADPDEAAAARVQLTLLYAHSQSYAQLTSSYRAAGRPHASLVRLSQMLLIPYDQLHKLPEHLAAAADGALLGSRAHHALLAASHEAAALAARHAGAQRWHEQQRRENERLAIRPELALFPSCAAAIAAEEGLRADHRVFIATDNSHVGAWLVAQMPAGRGVLLGERQHGGRIDGYDEKLHNATQARGAMLDLVLASRARALIGTHSSTYTMLAAGMSDASAHYLVYPAVFGRCVRATSPLSSHAALSNRMPAGPRTGWGAFSSVGGTSCADAQAMNALQALGGIYNPFVELREALFPPTDAERAAARLRTRAVRLLAGTREAEEEARAVRALIADYAELHAKQLAAAARAAERDEGWAGALAADSAAAPARLLLATAYCNNIGNRAMNLLAYVLLAMSSGRALILDSSWLLGFELPFSADVHALPEPLRRSLIRTLNGSTRVRTNWFETEPGFCGPLLPAECEGEAAVCAMPVELGAPHLLQLAANPQTREWYAEHIGYAGAGLRELMRWLFRPTADLVAEAERVERELCGAVRGCSIAMHVRRGPMHGNFFFPEEGRVRPSFPVVLSDTGPPSHSQQR